MYVCVDMCVCVCMDIFGSFWGYGRKSALFGPDARYYSARSRPKIIVWLSATLFRLASTRSISVPRLRLGPDLCSRHSQIQKWPRAKNNYFFSLWLSSAGKVHFLGRMRNPTLSKRGRKKKSCLTLGHYISVLLELKNLLEPSIELSVRPKTKMSENWGVAYVKHLSLWVLFVLGPTCSLTWLNLSDRLA